MRFEREMLMSVYSGLDQHEIGKIISGSIADCKKSLNDNSAYTLWEASQKLETIISSLKEEHIVTSELLSEKEKMWLKRFLYF